MTCSGLRHGLIARLRAGVGAALLCLALAGRPAVAEDDVVLSPHRAVYDLSLATARSGANVAAVAGRIVYDLAGSPCEGYTQKMRIVIRMLHQDGNSTVTDLRTSTWEDAAGRRFQFESSQFRDAHATETTSGVAVRRGTSEEIEVELAKPSKRNIFLPAEVYFPVQHTIALIRAARAGKTSFRADFYDGSEKGEKVYDTVSALGRERPPGSKRALPSVANAGRLDAARAWPVSIAHFSPRLDGQDALPEYEMSFWMFENGVSRKLSLDYGGFVLRGQLVQIEFHEPSTCRQPPAGNGERR